MTPRLNKADFRWVSGFALGGAILITLCYYFSGELDDATFLDACGITILGAWLGTCYLAVASRLFTKPSTTILAFGVTITIALAAALSAIVHHSLALEFPGEVATTAGSFVAVILAIVVGWLLTLKFLTLIAE